MHNKMEPLEKYTAIRAVVVHEDNLINQRFTWLILTEGLFVTAVYSGKILDVAIVHWTFAGLGILLSIMFGCSVLGAIDSIRDCTNRWNKILKKVEGPIMRKELEEDLPPVAYKTHSLKNYTYAIKIISFFLFPLFWIIHAYMKAKW